MTDILAFVFKEIDTLTTVLIKSEIYLQGHIEMVN